MGIQDVPRKRSDPHWFEFLQFHRAAFRNYLLHYIAEVKRTNPNLVPWDQMDDRIKQYDRDAVLSIPALVRTVRGMKICRWPRDSA